MALLDSISLFSNSTVIAKWANGKLGEIIPTDHSTYIFVEYEEIDGRKYLKYKIEDRDEKAPVLAYGFVYYWLRFRKRKSHFAQRLTSAFAPSHEGKTPKEIFDLYIDARKTWFLDTMSNRPDAWKYPDHEKMFYEQNLTTKGEKELILKSEPLLGYLDEEDKDEFIDVVKNFLGYVASIVEPYQHVMEEAARQKRIEQNTISIEALCKHLEEMDDEWPNPVRKQDNKTYSIYSTEILKLAESLTKTQVNILEQLIESASEIKTWQEKPVLNSYTDSDIYHAAYSMVENGLIDAMFACGEVSSIVILDKGKLVLRKYKTLACRTKEPLVIPEKYRTYVESVFTKTYTRFETEYNTYEKVRDIGRKYIQPNNAPLIGVFMQACDYVGCSKSLIILEASDIIEALIGLQVILENEIIDKNKLIRNLRIKLNSINYSQELPKDKEIRIEIVNMLGRNNDD